MITAKMGVYLGQWHVPKSLDLMTPELLQKCIVYGKPEDTSFGDHHNIRIGTVTVTFDAPLTNRQIVDTQVIVLKQQIVAVRADAEKKLTALQSEINNLLALEAK